MSSTEIRFDRTHRAIMWISTKSLSGNETLDVAEKVWRYSGELKPTFLACCFGKYDIVAEFSSDSAKVISDHVCKIEEALIGEERSDTNVCASLLLSNEVVAEESSSPNQNLPLRSYTYLNFKKGVDSRVMKEILKLIREIDSSNMWLLWNPSVYWLLLVTQGETLYGEVFPKLHQFRRKSSHIQVETCTFPTIGWNEEGILSDKSCEKSNIIDLTFVKLKDGAIGDLDIPESWNERWFGKNFSLIFRPGWFDLVLKIQKPTLKGLLLELLELRNRNEAICQTSSLILYPEGEENVS